MYFTRDPVIETVITARDGYKLSVRNSKHTTQDPFIVEAVEVICLGDTGFFRNCDRSRPFLVPICDYEIMEVRDARINLKAVGLDKGVKIAGGREALLKLSKPLSSNKVDLVEEDRIADSSDEVEFVPVAVGGSKEKVASGKKDFSKTEKWKEKKKQAKKKSSKDIIEAEDSSREVLEAVAEEDQQASPQEGAKKKFSLIPPPSKLISESFVKDEQEVVEADLEESLQVLSEEGDKLAEEFIQLEADNQSFFAEAEEESPEIVFQEEMNEAVDFTSDSSEE